MAHADSPLAHLRVPTEALRWFCDEALLDFETTAEVTPFQGVIGQDDAVEALRYGLEVDAHGQNIFVRGLVGTGRLTLVSKLLEQIRPQCGEAVDVCYVHNFTEPNRPRLIQVPKGRGKAFRDRIDSLADFLRDKLTPALSSDSLRAKQSDLEEQLQHDLEERGKPFEEAMRESGLTIVTIQAGGTPRPAILPVLEGETISPERLAQLQEEGKISEADADALRDKVNGFVKRFQSLGEELQTVREGHRLAVRDLFEREARALLQHNVRDIDTSFPFEAVHTFLNEVIEHVIGLRLTGQEPTPETDRLYRANLILEHRAGATCPIVVENTPTLHNLLGMIGRTVTPQGIVHSDHTMISAGSLLRAHGGYLVMEARDVLTEPGAWKVLMRTLRTGKLEIVPHDSAYFGMGTLLKPEPIAISVKVVLLGDPQLHYALDAGDPDFVNQFKVLADFDSSIERSESGVRLYAGVLARILEEEKLLPFARDGVAALAEHGARIAARSDRLTTRFGRLVDIAREAAFLAKKDERGVVRAADVIEAVTRSKRRADLPARHFRRMVNEGTIRIQTRGEVVGQINGLAVTHSGPLTYGFPARITAAIGPGTGGTVNIEREAQLSGAIHTKGFYILGGLMRHLLRTVHPLAFTASIAFEQSYGGIDGDSASGAETCCLLSALTDIPLRQDLAMTGAIDQHGHVQAIGAISEKIEGFFDTCRHDGLTGTQGVIFPRSNLRDLMLRRDVVEACAKGEFHVYAVDTIGEALTLFTGRPAGERDADGAYPEDSVLGIAVAKAGEYWAMISGGDVSGDEEEADGEEGEGVEAEEAAE